MDVESYIYLYGKQHRELITLALGMLEGKDWAGPGFDVHLYLLHLLPRPMVRFVLSDGLVVDPSSVEMHDATSGTAYAAGLHDVVAVVVDGVEGALNATQPPSADFVVRPLPALQPAPRKAPMPPPAPAKPDRDPELEMSFALARYKAETERLMVLTNFLAQTVKAPQDAEGNSDPDVVAAYNVTVETVLKHVRAVALAGHPRD